MLEVLGFGGGSGPTGGGGGGGGAGVKTIQKLYVTNQNFLGK